MRTHKGICVYDESLTSFWFVQWCGIYITGALSGWLMHWLRLCCFCQSEISGHEAHEVTFKTQ